MRGFGFRGVRTTGSKESRANLLSSSAEQGNVRLVRGSWSRDFLDESEIEKYLTLTFPRHVFLMFSKKKP